MEDFSSLILSITLFGFVLSADSFSAALAMGFRPHNLSDAFKFALASGLAEGGATFIGAATGKKVFSALGFAAEWIAPSLLILVALHMAHEGWQELNSKPQNEVVDFHSLTKILVVSLVTSIDALGVGVSLAVSQKNILPYCLSIAFWAFAATLLGLYLARKISGFFGPIFIFFGSFTLMCLAIQL